MREGERMDGLGVEKRALILSTQFSRGTSFVGKDEGKTRSASRQSGTERTWSYWRDRALIEEQVLG